LAGRKDGEFMKLKKKTITICIILCLLPIVLIVCIGGIFLVRQLNIISNTYGVDSSGIVVMQNPMIAYNSVIQKNIDLISSELAKNPEKIENKDYLDELNAGMSDYCSYLYVVKDGSYVYKSNDEILKDVIPYMPEYGSYSDTRGSLYVNTNTGAYLIEQLDEEYQDSFYSMYIVLNVDEFLPEVIHAAKGFVIVLLVIILIFLLCMIILMYQVFITPVTELSKATHDISSGNLDTAIETTHRKDEIGQLQRDFEEMRVHLKDSIEQHEINAQRSREMMSNISHDLKTPLTAIKGYSEGLLDGVADTPEKQQKYLKTIYTKACSMEKLVDELSYFSKIDNRTLTYNFIKIPIKDFILDCVDELRMDMEVSHIYFMESYQCDEGINVIIDPNEVKRVITNIISNSIKYMDKDHGEIRLRVMNDNDFVWITVEDNGCGIAKKDVSNIFERFYRADSSRGSKKGGTGLGLAIVKSIVEAHGGVITADSILGVGTSIRFSLPIDKEKEPVQEEAIKSSGRHEKAKKNKHQK
jgi:signal transduction histidine kinase